MAEGESEAAPEPEPAPAPKVIEHKKPAAKAKTTSRAKTPRTPKAS
jgi:hypothetical protein